MKKERPQERYDKEKTAVIRGKYKKEFVEDFKDACTFLTQHTKEEYYPSKVIKAAMVEVIEKANHLKKELEDS